MAKQAILLVEDDPAIADFLKTAIGRDPRYSLQHAGSLREAQEQILQRRKTHAGPFRVILLDLGLPDGDGMDVIPWIRAGLPETLIMVLSARHQEAEKIRAFQSGADDYLTKPFTPGELVARMEAHLRRLQIRPQETNPSVGGWSLMDESRLLKTAKGREVALTMKEYQIVRILLLNMGKAVSHQRLLTAVWGPTHADQTHYLRIYIQRLREKLEEDPNHPRHIITESGIGYRLILD